MRELFPLNARVIARPISRSVKFVKRGRAKQLVIFGKNPFVMAERAVRSVEALVVRAAGKAALAVVNNAVVVHECRIVALVAQIGQARPAADVGRGDPDMVGSKAAGRNGLSEPDDTFVNRTKFIEQRW